MPKLPKELDFEDKTLLSTPNPIHTSSMAYAGAKLSSFSNLNDIPERECDSDSNSSLGILSNKSIDEIFPNVRLSTEAALLQKQRELARSTLKQAAARLSSEFTSLPSRYLRPSDVSENSDIHYIHSESTISESDLLQPGNSSTPRQSLACIEYAMRDRPSRSESICSLANRIRNDTINLNTIADVAQKTIGSEGSFRSGEDAVAKLVEDEMSWKLQRHIPSEMTEFSVNSVPKLSMGSFFWGRSDEPCDMFAKSPEKSHPPVPLVDVSTTSEPGDNLSDIQHILSEQNTNEALDILFAMEPAKSKNTSRKSRNSGSAEKVSDNLRKHEKEHAPVSSKENILPTTHHEKSTLSSRSSSSLSSLPNGKLPIATTKNELIWGCVKPGKSISRDFVIRNRSSSRVGIQCSVSNPSFRLNKEGPEANFSSVMKVILHPYESRTVTITFAPTTIGAAVDNLNFTSTDPNHKQTVKQFIRLYAYGGYGSITIQKIIKDTMGKFLLSLGNIDDQQELKQVFAIKNTGSLAAFAYFDLSVNGVHSLSNVNVYPQTAVLLPGEEREVSVTYSVQKKDFAYIKSKINNCVIDIGKVQVIHGTEVDRARLRKLCQKAQEKDHNVSSFALQLIEKFPGEVIPTDLKHFRESFISLEELLRLLSNEEIVVTLEQDVDHTLTTSQFSNETAMYYSLCENTNVNVLESTTFRETCIVEPNRIILTPPDKIKDKIFLTNNNQKTLYYEVSSAPEGLFLKPKEGTIRSGETLIIEAQYTKKCNDKTVFKVRILVDNESFEVDVKVVFC